MRKTNDQKLRKIIKDLHPVELALLTERIETMMNMTIEDIKVRPEMYDNFIVSHTAYVGMAQKVLTILNN
jgi:hypothetical protein